MVRVANSAYRYALAGHPSHFIEAYRFYALSTYLASLRRFCAAWRQLR